MTILAADWSSFADNRLIVGLFTAFFGFVFGILLERVKARATPKKKLSWDLALESGFVRFPESVRARIQVAWDGIPVRNLFQISYRVENTGNTVIKDQQLRFEFPRDSDVLDIWFDPRPERELGVKLEPHDGLTVNERLYTIKHLEVGRSVRFVWMAEGGEWSGWKGIYPHNDEGDVEVLQRDAANAKEDEEEVRPFFTILLLFVLALVFGAISPPLVAYPAFILAAVLAAFLLVKAGKIVRVLRRVLGKALPYNVNLDRPQGVQIGGSNSQNNTWSPPRRPEPPVDATAVGTDD